ncbi:hypothetical protein EYF80_002016 [Liparis tanakae]|uniref:Uncharacterized protein n=1 Tax=Liparis tanakae TaxID=230148 RepID=A0A4Z2JBR2_9TELE|nr:hypothetical protein EYF80_002016 [Liparis tanakae]
MQTYEDQHSSEEEEEEEEESEDGEEEDDITSAESESSEDEESAEPEDQQGVSRQQQLDRYKCMTRGDSHTLGSATESILNVGQWRPLVSEDTMNSWSCKVTSC